MVGRAVNDAAASARLFGQRLKRNRLASRLSKAQLSERTGISAAYIARIERGCANPTLTTMDTLADAVGAAVSDMVKPLV